MLRQLRQKPFELLLHDTLDPRKTPHFRGLFEAFSAFSPCFKPAKHVKMDQKRSQGTVHLLRVGPKDLATGVLQGETLPMEGQLAP